MTSSLHIIINSGKQFATGRHSSTVFYHLVDIAVDNAFIIYNVLVHRKRCRTVSENYFRVLLTIKEYGRTKRQEQVPGRQCRSDFQVQMAVKFLMSKSTMPAMPDCSTALMVIITGIHDTDGTLGVQCAGCGAYNGRSMPPPMFDKHVRECTSIGRLNGHVNLKAGLR